jgi:Flp pilus assembly protein TadB
MICESTYNVFLSHEEEREVERITSTLRSLDVNSEQYERALEELGSYIGTLVIDQYIERDNENEERRCTKTQRPTFIAPAFESHSAPGFAGLLGFLLEVAFFFILLAFSVIGWLLRFAIWNVREHRRATRPAAADACGSSNKNVVQLQLKKRR